MWKATHKVAQRHNQDLPHPRVHALLVAGTEHLHKRRKVIGQDGEEERLWGIRVDVGHGENEAAQHSEDMHCPNPCPDSMHLGGGGGGGGRGGEEG